MAGGIVTRPVLPSSVRAVPLMAIILSKYLSLQNGDYAQ